MGSKVEDAWKKSTVPGMIYESMKPPDMPDAPVIPPPVEEIDVAGQTEYTKKRLKAKKGRKSTILSKLGNTNSGKKTVLG